MAARLNFGTSVVSSATWRLGCCRVAGSLLTRGHNDCCVVISGYEMTGHMDVDVTVLITMVAAGTMMLALVAASSHD